MFAEEVDIVPKLPANFTASLKSSKWKERKEALDELLNVVNASPRIKEASELGEVIRSLAVCVQKDANINCVMVAAGCLEGMAKGMMGSFARYRESIVPPMLERLKERKVTVTDSIGNALDAIFVTVSSHSTPLLRRVNFHITKTTLTDILPDVLPALNNKNPQVKDGTLKFIARSLSTSPTPIPTPQIKPLSEALASLLEDPFEGARTEAAICLGTLMKMVGERPLNALMDSLADMRKVKVKEAFDTAKVKAKVGAAAPPKAAAPGSKEPAKKKPPPAKQPPTTALPAVPTEDEFPPENKPVKKPPARLMVSAILFEWQRYVSTICVRRGRNPRQPGPKEVLPRLRPPPRNLQLLLLSPRLQLQPNPLKAAPHPALALSTMSSSSIHPRMRKRLRLRSFQLSMPLSSAMRTGRRVWLHWRI